MKIFDDHRKFCCWNRNTNKRPFSCIEVVRSSVRQNIQSVYMCYSNEITLSERFCFLFETLLSFLGSINRILSDRIIVRSASFVQSTSRDPWRVYCRYKTTWKKYLRSNPTNRIAFFFELLFYYFFTAIRTRFQIFEIRFSPCWNFAIYNFNLKLYVYIARYNIILYYKCI